jgi:hypothetical protein
MQSDDPAIRALARRIIGGETDAWRAALALERWVSDSMHFDLGIAFAPSTEVVRQRRGTCIAYATLLGTLIRSLGIPSRLAFGYVYVNGMYGGHAWAEVLLDGRWTPVDGAIVGDGSADAARFAFAWTSLADGPGAFTASPGARLYGAIRAKVLAWRVAGERAVDADTAAPPYTIAEGVYRNASLGLEVASRAGERFVALDETWPDMTVLGITTTGGDTVLVRSYDRPPWSAPMQDARARAAGGLAAGAAVHRVAVSGRPCILGASPGSATLAMPDGSETLTITAAGPDAEARVREVAQRIRLARPPQARAP